MIASSAGRNRSFWRSSRGLATASPNADDPPPNRTNRPKRESQIARNQRLAAVFPRNRLLLSPRFARRLNAHAILHGRRARLPRPGGNGSLKRFSAVVASLQSRRERQKALIGS